MRLLDSEIDIDAPAGRVWDLLLDFPRYPDWNPFIIRIAGTPRTGSRLQVTLALEGRRPRNESPQLIALEAGRTLRWFGRLLLPQILDSEHTFSLQPLGPQRTQFRHQEILEGLLVPFHTARFRETEAAFRRMNEALKRQAEAGRSASLTGPATPLLPAR